MIDTLKIIISPSEIPDDYYESQFLNFKNISITKNDQGEKWAFGTYKNLRIGYNKYGITIEGSLSKYWYGSNQYTLNDHEFAMVIEKLSVDLQLPLLLCKVMRVDFGENIFTENLVESYYNILGDIPRFQKFSDEKWNRISELKNTICLYNKIKELKKVGERVTDIFQGKNVLRYEYRMLNQKAISKFLNLSSVTVNDLINNYQKFVDKWTKIFERIYKNNNLIVFNPKVFSEKKGLEKQIMIAGINQLGGLDVVLNQIKMAQKSKLFSYGNKPINLTGKLKLLMQTPVLTEKSKLGIELETKVKLISLVSSNREYLWT